MCHFRLLQVEITSFKNGVASSAWGLNTLLKLTSAVVELVFAGGAQAGIITYYTDILSGSGHEQLSAWLGQDVDLTRIFAKGVNGSYGTPWHSAVNNKGVTITVMAIFNGSERMIIGTFKILMAIKWYRHEFNKPQQLLIQPHYRC